MKSKYVIGFFCAVFFAVILLTAGYQLSYSHVMDRQSARAEEEVPTTALRSPGRSTSGSSVRKICGDSRGIVCVSGKLFELIIRAECCSGRIAQNSV